MKHSTHVRPKSRFTRFLRLSLLVVALTVVFCVAAPQTAVLAEWTSINSLRCVTVYPGTLGGTLRSVSSPEITYRIVYTPSTGFYRITLFTTPAPVPAPSSSPIPAPPAPAPVPAPSPSPIPAPPAPAPVPAPSPSPIPAPPVPAPSAPAGVSAMESQMVALINTERAKVGLPLLRVDPELVRLARLKSADMVENGYFSHTSPTYGSPFDMMKEAGVAYTYAGENLAGAPNVAMAHASLMQSPGHRANILRKEFTAVGIGVVKGGPYGYMFTQMFIGR